MTSIKNLRCKVIDVFFFRHQCGFGDKHREITVFEADLLNLRIEPALNAFPDAKRPRTQHIAATYIVILYHLSLRNNLCMTQNQANDCK